VVSTNKKLLKLLYSS